MKKANARPGIMTSGKDNCEINPMNIIGKTSPEANAINCLSLFVCPINARTRNRNNVSTATTKIKSKKARLLPLRESNAALDYC